MSEIGSSELSAEEKEAVRTDLLERVDSPIWFYDFERCSIVWANSAALGLWNAPNAAELAARDLRSEMSLSVEERLQQVAEDLERDAGQTFKEVWTFYPAGKSIAVECVFHHGGLKSGRSATMITGRPVTKLDEDPDMIRAVDALLHTRAIAGLYTLDGERLFNNRSLRSTLGADASASQFGDFFTDPAKKGTFLKAVNAGGTWRDVVEVQTTEGARWHDIEAAPCRDAVSGKPAFHVSAMDVTEAKLATEGLKYARDEAERANRAKSDFIANMSHEMRTPMNGVLGLLEVLRTSSLTPDQKELVRIARDSGVALLELIEDVLDISSTELRAASLEATAFDPGALAAKVIEGLSAPAAQKGLDLKLQVCPNLPGEAFGDERRLAQVMRNLVGNAIKYTETGFIQLTLKQIDGALQVIVSDTGVGIPDAQKSRIFDRFYQLNETTGKVKDGVGLGLSIVKDIVDLWGGDLTVEDAAGCGSSFAFTLPNAFGEQNA